MNSCLPVWEPFSLNANARFFTVLKRCHPERPRRSLRLRASRRIPRMFPSPCCFREFSPGFLLLLYSLRTAASNPRYGSKEDTQIQKLTGKNHHLFPIRVYPRKSAVSSFPITLAMTGPPGKPGYGLLGCDHARLRRSRAITAIGFTSRAPCNIPRDAAPGTASRSRLFSGVQPGCVGTANLQPCGSDNMPADIACAAHR
jgi:hypothetical protein